MHIYFIQKNIKIKTKFITLLRLPKYYFRFSILNVMFYKKTTKHDHLEKNKLNINFYK